jgi:hypothetical protein
MKRVEIKMELIRDIVSGISHVARIKGTEGLIDYLTRHGSNSYYLNVEDDQVKEVVSGFSHDFDGDTLNTVKCEAIGPIEDAIEITDKAIEHLSANAQIGYLLHNDDAKEDDNKQVVMIDGNPVAVTDVSSVTNADNKGKIAFLGMDIGKRDGIGAIQSWAPYAETERFSEIGGAKVDAVFFDEVGKVGKMIDEADGEE